MNKKIWTNIIVLVVIALVLLGGFLFNKARRSVIPEESRIVAPFPEQKAVETSPEIVVPEEEKIVILATVNGTPITSEELDREWEILPSQYRDVFHEDKLEAWVEELKSKAKITRNGEWINAQRIARTKNPLDDALKKDRPVLADFGRGVCIPCKQMKPVLEELAIEYEGKVSILIIEIDEYPALTRRHHIRLIPTQIFFDAEGNEVYRHEGFMSKEAIKEKLKEIGVK